MLCNRTKHSVNNRSFVHLLCHDAIFSLQICIGLFLSFHYLLIIGLNLENLPLLILFSLLYDCFKNTNLLFGVLLTLNERLLVSFNSVLHYLTYHHLLFLLLITDLSEELGLLL